MNQFLKSTTFFFSSTNILPLVTNLIPAALISISAVYTFCSMEAITLTDCLHSILSQDVANLFDRYFITISDVRTHLGELKLIQDNAVNFIREIDLTLNEQDSVASDDPLVHQRDLEIERFSLADDEIEATPEYRERINNFIDEGDLSIANGLTPPTTFRGEFEISYNSTFYGTVAIISSIAFLLLCAYSCK